MRAWSLFGLLAVVALLVGTRANTQEIFGDDTTEFKNGATVEVKELPNIPTGYKIPEQRRQYVVQVRDFSNRVVCYALTSTETRGTTGDFSCYETNFVDEDGDKNQTLPIEGKKD